MTIEEEFFKAFGIEPDCSYLFLIDEKGTNEAAKTLSFGSKADLKRFIVNCGGKGRVVKSTNSPHIYYPEITAEILLKLICILNKYLILVYGLGERYNKYKYNDLKKEILENCCTYAKYFKVQEQEKRLEDFKNEVRKLFEEE